MKIDQQGDGFEAFKPAQIKDGVRLSDLSISVAALHGESFADVTYTLDVDGYDTLARVLTAAYEQAAVGKGKERHANNLPFDKQPMQSLSDLLATEHGMAFQAMKKVQEALRMGHDAKKRELLGAIVYIAGMLIWTENNKCNPAETPRK